MRAQHIDVHAGVSLVVRFGFCLPGQHRLQYELTCGDVAVATIFCFDQVPGAVAGICREDQLLGNFDGFIVLALQIVGHVGDPRILLLARGLLLQL